MVLSKNLYFTIFLLGFLFGVWVTNITQDIILSLLLYSFFLCLSVVFLHHYRQFIYCLIFLSIAYTLGIWISSIEQNVIDRNTKIVDKYIWSYTHFVWETKELYRRKEFYDEYLVELRKIEDIVTPSPILHILRIPKNFSLDIGQVISYNWVAYSLEDFDGFSYKRYMLSRGIYFSTSSTVVDTLEESRQWFQYHLFQVRNNFLERISYIFPENEAIFLWGILLWARENIPKDLQEDFNNSGLTHFIAVSGFNITLCILFITFLFWFLPPWARIISVGITIIVFSFFVGLWAPVVRAAIMGIIWYIFLQSWQNIKNITLLTFTAVCMVLYSPLSINYDVSLHLSFLAVIGIIYTQDFFKRFCIFLPKIFAIQEAFVLTLSALSFSLPIMIFQFGQVSLLAPFANIAVTWTIPLAMLGGVITLLVDFISPFFGKWLGFITWILLHYDMLVVRFFGNLEGALLHFDFGYYKNYLQMLYFIFLIYFVALYHQRRKKQP